ncbi:MAG: WD40/YVTN/BNR-like repeat-containing protein [Candidatus Acidiferrales bacterium]
MNTYIRFRSVVFVAAILMTMLWAVPPGYSQEAAPQSFAGMRWRLIGPFRGGRAIAVTGVPGKPFEYYFGAVGGGVWHSSNAGRTWEPIFDAEPISSIGAIAVAPSAPKIIYVGSGEADMRSDISFGDGMYKSTDGGGTWKNIGLRDSEQIGRVIVDPRDPNIVLVAALGHAYGPNSERGVYRSTDGGETWTRVLGNNDDTGAIDLSFDPGNSQVVYASLWQTRRPPWTSYPPSNGPGSGLYKSVDGGMTWRQISGHGFPSEGLGRIGIAVAPGENGNRVYAVVDAKEGGLYRSDDAGANWRRVCSDIRIWMRGWYFGGVTADPHNPDMVYVANTSLYRSTDGGANFTAIKGAPGGDDYHQLWIAPEDSNRMVLGSDQGVIVSVDGGKTWSSWYNQPTGQFYHLVTDGRFPYMVYGTQQDSGTAAVSSRSDFGQISYREWSPVGGEESGYIALNPAEPYIVFGGGPFGGLSRFDWSTGQSSDISPRTPSETGGALRFNWNAPLVVSPQDAHIMYFAAQMVFRTDNEGSSWKAISPDLTVRAPAHGASNVAKEENRGVVYTIAPSPVRTGEIWTGSDNGVIQITTDEGKNWMDVTPAGLPDWSRVSLIEASHFDSSTAYAAIDRHQMDDFHPYIYRTQDSGKTWKNVTSGLPEHSYVHVVREDTMRKGLLFAGTETGVYVSLNDGDSWQPLQLNLPVTPIHDINIHEYDLAVATHGRAFWILDDIEPIREWADTIAGRKAYLFHPAHALRIRRSENRDTPLPMETPVGENPPAGALIDYYLEADLSDKLTLEIRDMNGDLVRRFSSADKPLAAPADPPEFPDYWLPKPQRLETTAGMHRFLWDMRYPAPAAVHADYSQGALIHGGTEKLPKGRLVLPGKYQAWLIVENETHKQTFMIDMDPRVEISAEDLQAQSEFLRKIDDDLAETTRAYLEVSNVRGQLAAVKKQFQGDARLKDLQDAVEQFEMRAKILADGKPAVWPDTGGGMQALDAAFTALSNAAEEADRAPTAQAAAAFEDCEKRLREIAEEWDAMKQKDLPALNEKLRQAGMPSVALGAKPGDSD